MSAKSRGAKRNRSNGHERDHLQRISNADAKAQAHGDDLVEIFRGKIEEPREFFERVMSCRYHGEDRSDVVIPYRSVIEFYRQDCHFYKDVNPKHKGCACGCGRPVFDRQKWASPGCRKRAQREQSVTANFAEATS